MSVSCKKLLKGKLKSRVGCVRTKNGMKLCRSRVGARPKFVGKCGRG